MGNPDLIDKQIMILDSIAGEISKHGPFIVIDQTEDRYSPSGYSVTVRMTLDGTDASGCDLDAEGIDWDYITINTSSTEEI